MTASRIRVLDEQTINKIAAGEVVENPASVVKELIENALDAGSKNLCIEIKGGGRQLIRVSDDGHGMGPDDALLCFERHGTSKMRAIEDIHSLTSMGFRGEAVPSIASISKLTLLTSPHQEGVGTLVIADGGRIIKRTDAARSQGTTVEVKSLFFNVPVRKKFQRSPTHDTNEILKIVTLQALARPDVAFQLISNQKKLLSTLCPDSPSFKEKLGERIPAALGKEFFAGMSPVEREHKGLKLTGFIGMPAHTRPNRTGQYLFVNGRAVFSLPVSYAVRDAYGTTLPTNRHPVFVLHLTLPGSLVDVNVHPQKREVRFRQERELKELITFSIEEAVNAAPSPAFAFPKIPAFQPLETSQTPSTSFAHPKPPVWKSLANSPAPTPWEYRATEEAPSEAETFLKTPQKTTPRVIAVLHGYLLLFSETGGLMLVDQRAAHARILYERLLNKEQGNVAVQQLLIPDTLELTPLEAAQLTEHLAMFHELGFDIREFGQHSFIIHAIPQIWADKNLRQFFKDILHELGDEQEGVGKREKQIAQAASRAAISQKKHLSLPEGQALVDQLFQCESPYLCPHGKPTVVEMSKEEIAKRFQK